MDALATTEVQRLEVLESVIDAGMQTFVHVGNALLEIRDSRLYRAQFGTFEDYCRERWGFTDRRARMLMSAAETVANIQTGTIVPFLPATESQARPLTALDPAQQREAWQRVEISTPVTGRDGKQYPPTKERKQQIVQNDNPLQQESLWCL